jgi:predicted amidohydrolase YtcJ
VLLDQNLFDMAPRHIADVKALVTMIGGSFAHREGI